jgi:hypothetical protein
VKSDEFLAFFNFVRKPRRMDLGYLGFRINLPILNIFRNKDTTYLNPFHYPIIISNELQSPTEFKALFRAKFRNKEGKCVDLVVDSRVVFSV